MSNVLGKIGGNSSLVLGLAIGRSWIDIAQVRKTKTGAKLEKSARFTPASGLQWEKAPELGKALGDFLQQQRFSAKTAVVGMPGRLLLARARPMPPMAPAVATPALRMMIEREFAGDARDWVFDFDGLTSSKEKSQILLASTPRDRLNRISDTLKFAGLRVASVTSTLLALQASTRTADGTRGTLHLTDDSVELSMSVGGRVVLCEQLTGPRPAQGDPATQADVNMTALAGDIRRTLATSTVSSAAPDWTIFNSSSIPQASIADLARRIGAGPDALAGLDAVGLNEVEGTADVGAAALGVVGVSSALSIDFLHSKLDQKPEGFLTRPRLFAGMGVAIVLLGALYVAGEWYQQRNEVDDLKANLAAIKDNVAAAHENIDRLTLARGWYDGRPQILGSLRALTLAFPPENTVWATSVSVRDDLSGTLAGKSASEKPVLELLDRLRSSKTFSNVKLLYMRQADRTNRSVSFALTFAYTGGEDK